VCIQGGVKRVGEEELHFIKGMRIFQSLFFSVERVINGDIQIPFILAIRSTCQLSRDRLISLPKVNQNPNAM
jgi:hypothetical protein